LSGSKKLADHAESVFLWVAEHAVGNRIWVFIACVVLMIGAAFGISKVRVDTSIGNVFTPQDPSYIAYKDYLDGFATDELCYLLYTSSKPEGIFNYQVMQSIAALTETLESEVPFVDEVTSLANVEFIQAVGEDDIEIDDLLIDFPKDQRALSALKEKVLAKQNYKNLVVSKDGKYAAIILQMSVSRLDALEKLKLDPNGGSFSSNIYPSVSFAKAREIISRPEYRGISFNVTGDVSINAERNRIITVNNAIIVAATLGMVLLLSLFFFNATLTGVLAPLAVVIMSILFTVGLMGIMDWSIGVFFGLVPTLLCAIGVAQSVHILIDYQRVLIDTHDRNEAISNAIRKVGGPCLLAALTTAVSFLVMTVSEMQSMRELALYAAAGIFSTFIFSIAVLVVCLARHPRNSKTEKNLYTDFSVHRSVTAWIESSIRLNQKHSTVIIFISFALLLVSIAGLPNLKVKVELIEDFKENVLIRQDTEFVESKMSGNASVVYLFDTHAADGVKNTEFLKGIEMVQNFADTVPLVRDTRSINNILKELNQSFNQDNRDYFKLPLDQELLSQYLLLYEFSGGAQLDDFVNYNYSKAALKLRLSMASSQELAEAIEQIDEFIAANPVADSSAQVTGMGLLWVKIGEYIIETQIASYVLVFMMIAVVVSLVFGSIKVGMASMLPNLGPIFMCMGVMGWIGVPLDHYKIMLGTIALGIAVDDTIHLVTRFRSRFMQTGNYEKAMARCLRDVGSALIITTLILVGAFSTYLLSEMETLSSFGILLAASISLALLADLYFMPCLIMRLKLFGPEFDAEHDDVEDIFDRFDQSRDARLSRI